MSEKINKVEAVERSVIERRLLASLKDESKAAILCTEQDLDDLIASLATHANSVGCLRSLSATRTANRCKEFAASLIELKDAAFPKPLPQAPEKEGV